MCLQMYGVCKLSPAVYSLAKASGFVLTLELQQIRWNFLEVFSLPRGGGESLWSCSGTKAKKDVEENLTLWNEKKFER